MKRQLSARNDTTYLRSQHAMCNKVMSIQTSHKTHVKLLCILHVINITFASYNLKTFIWDSRWQNRHVNTVVMTWMNAIKRYKYTLNVETLLRYQRHDNLVWSKFWEKNVKKKFEMKFFLEIKLLNKILLRSNLHCHFVYSSSHEQYI